MKLALNIFYGVLLIFICCGQASNSPAAADQPVQTGMQQGLINDSGVTVQTRFNPPSGFERNVFDTNSFANYTRNLPLKPAGSKVKYFNGAIKNELVYDAVVDMDIGNKDLQQCADAVMRLRAEYFYSQKAYEKISFTLTNGFNVDYSEWMNGKRIVVAGNKTSWRKTGEPSNTYKDFRSYLDLVFNYAGTLSLSKSLHSKNLEDISIGDVFISGGSPGHAVIVVDVAENKSGERVFLLAQSYMPAQEIQILKNPADHDTSPWYGTHIQDKLVTPQWIFTTAQLKTW